MIQNILNKNEDNNIFLYLDKLKNEQLNKLRADIFYTINFTKNSNQSQSWNLEAELEMFNAELFALEKAFKVAWNLKSNKTKNIQIFSDSQAAIKRLRNSAVKAGQYYVQSIKKWAEKFKNLNILLILEWVSGHMNIYRNEMVDKAAKRGIEMQNSSLESYILLAFIKKRIKKSTLLE